MSSAPSPSNLGGDVWQGNIDDFLNIKEQFHTNQSDTLTNLPKDTATCGDDSVAMVSQDADAANTIKTIMETADAEPRNLCGLGSEVNSTGDMVSPSAGSSDFSAMESDGEGIEIGMDDASLSGIGDKLFQQSNGYYGSSTPLEYTTTPCASSSACDDDFESTGSHKKRRKTRRDMHHPLYNPAQVNDGQSLRFPRASTQESWPHDPETSQFSHPTCPKGTNCSRRSSGGGFATAQITRAEVGDENVKRLRTCNDSLNGDELLNTDNAVVKLEMPTAMDTPVRTTKSGMRRRRGAGEEDQILHKQYPCHNDSYELRIATQPESQHRARYLTEGSRGPVKDAAQRGFPEVELVGYNGPATLEVFVATESGKVKPHGFYQACKVTGRNTSPCEELEIAGTKVIRIPCKQDGMLLSIDCVGILKLRNSDVEVRTGIRNQKRNQSVRLAFRVSFSPDSGGNNVVLQTTSNRISCSQPLGQPEITKKSVDRCSVEGGIDIFIIGKNFHRGTKVLYQDPEEPDGKQWCAEGDVDKDTFHQSHMVVRVPPYHDQDIQKPVNVQLLVEFQDKRCEPHSFTYTPRPKEPEAKKVEPKKIPPQAQANIGTSNIESALNLLDGPIDKKFLVALFSELLAGGITGQPDSPVTSDAPEPIKSELHPSMVNAGTFPNPHSLINVTAAPFWQGMLQPQLQTVVKVPPSEPPKSVVNPIPAPIAINPFANLQFSLHSSKMSFTQDLNSATPIVSPISQVTFNPSTVITFPFSHSSFNPTLNAGIATPTPQITAHSLPVSGAHALVSQVNLCPSTHGGLPTSVFHSVGSLPTVFTGSNVKIKLESIPNVTLTNALQTIPIMAASTSQQPGFRGVAQTLPPQVAFALPAQHPTPPLVASPVSQTQLGQEGILYNSFSATLANAASMFGSTTVSFAGDTLTNINQSSGNSFPNISMAQGDLGSQSFPEAVVFTDSGITSTPSQQMQTQPAPTFQESPGQQMQQQHILAAVSTNQVFINQAHPLFATNISPVSHNPGNMVQNPISVATFVPTQMMLRPGSMQQMASSFVDKKQNQYTIQANQNSKVQTVQSPNDPSSQQFTAPTTELSQQQLTSFGSQNQQQFGISVQEQPMQQDQHGSVTGQKETQYNQQHVGFGVSNQQQFSTVAEDYPMPQERQQPIAVTHQQFCIGSEAQQKPVFNNQTQHFSVGLQDPIPQQSQLLPSAQSELGQQSFPVAPQDQTRTQQPTAVTQQQFCIGSQAQQKPVFNNNQTQHSSVGLQDPMQQQAQLLSSAQNEIGHQSFPVAPQDQTRTQQPIAVTQQQFCIGSQAQQKPVFNNQIQHFSVGLQDPIQQQPQLQSEIRHQSFPVAPQDQTRTQQQHVAQIAHVQQVVQIPPNAIQSEDIQMHVDPFIQPQSTGNLQAQSSNAIFNTQQTVIQSVIQPMEEMSQPSNTNRTSDTDQRMNDLSPPQVQQQQQQQSFHIQCQPAPMTVASEIAGVQIFQSQQPVVSAPAAISMLPIVPPSALNVQDFRNVQQPANASMVAAQGQNFSSPPQVRSLNAQAQTGISAALIPPQTFPTQLAGQNIAAEVSNSAPMPAQQYQSPEAVTKSPPSMAVPAATQQGYQTTQAQNPQSPTNSAQMQMYKHDYPYQDSSTGQIQQQRNVRTQRETNATLQQRQTLGVNISVNRPFQPQSPDFFAMTQLLQSIDGSANLEAISGEDVQRHCQ